MNNSCEESYIAPNDENGTEKFSSKYASKGICTSRIINCDSAKDELICGCCLLIVWDPVCCSTCESHFCNVCIIEWLKYKKNNTCPICQSEFESHPIPRITKNLLSKLKISCKNKDNGCKEPIDYQSIYLHESQCLYALEICPNIDCGLQMTKLDYINHRDICPHLIVPCKFCNELLKNRDREAHELECPYRKVMCGYENCNQMLIAMDYEKHLEECNFKPMICEYCSLNIVKKELEVHLPICDEKPVKCKGCDLELKLKALKAHEETCELIDIKCGVCEKTFKRKDLQEHDKISCLEAALLMIKNVLYAPEKKIEKEKDSLFENNKIALLEKKIESQANEILLLRKELMNVQMNNLTDSKLNFYSLLLPNDNAHKTISLNLVGNQKLRRNDSYHLTKLPKMKNELSFQDLKLSLDKTFNLNLPENISVKKHNYMSVCSLNAKYLVIGDDLGRLCLWDLEEEQELAETTIKKGSEVKALALFSYESFAKVEELYSINLGNLSLEKTFSLSLLGYWVISGHGNGEIYVWDIEIDESSASFRMVSQISSTSTNKISCILDLEDQKHFITASYGANNKLEIYDCLSDVMVFSSEKPHKATISKIALLEKKTKFISSSDDGFLKIWRIIRGPLDRIQNIQCEKNITLNEPFWSLGVINNEKIVVALNNFNLEIYDLVSRDLIKSVETSHKEDDPMGLIGDLVVINVKNQEEEKNDEEKDKFLILALHKDRVVVYDDNLKQLLTVVQSHNEFKWGYLASHLMQVLVTRRLNGKQGEGFLIKVAVLGQKGKKISVLELMVS